MPNRPSDDDQKARQKGEQRLSPAAAGPEEIRVRLKDGPVITLAAWPGSERVDGKLEFVAVSRDLAEQTRAEEALKTAYLDLVRDLTEHKRIEEALHVREELLRAILEHAPMSMAIIGMDGTIEYINRKAEVTFGYSPADIPTMDHWWLLAYPDDSYRSEVMATWTGLTEKALAEHHEIEGREYRVTCKDGAVKTMVILGVPVAGKVFVMFEDMTQRKLAEEALREADQRKNEFLGVLSHELRNPLTPIRNSLYVLDRLPPEGEQSRKARAVIDRQVGHLSRLVDDLLDVTRITRGKIRLQRGRLDLVGVVRQTVEDYRTVLESHELAVKLETEPIWLHGDATRLAQVIANLLANAAKFTPRGARISVSLTRAGDRAVLEVSDAGMGIDSATLRRLFEPFAQADRTLDRSSGGLGLGLALVKGLAELHGGEVTARSDGPGKGACFTLKLPLAEHKSAAQGSEEPSASVPKGRRVLIIEDNPGVAESLSGVLEIWGHQFAVAGDGVSGLAQAREFRPEIILCDIGLPDGMDGYEVARALRRNGATASVYLVALSGYAQPEDQSRALAAGFDAHLAKPADLELLERLLAQAPVQRGQAGKG